MTLVLICSTRPLPELYDTLVWRDDVERIVATNRGDALKEATRGPKLAVIDAELPGATELIETLRSRDATRTLSIAVVIPEGLDVELKYDLKKAANVALEHPAGPHWDEQLSKLTSIAPRHAVRVAVRLQLAASRGGTRITGFAHNLSETGMLVECVLALTVGDELRFALDVPESTQKIMGQGRVVREQRAAGSGVTSYGIQFLSMDEAARHRVRALVSGPGRSGRR